MAMLTARLGHVTVTQFKWLAEPGIVFPLCHLINSSDIIIWPLAVWMATLLSLFRSV